jgi:glutathione S-transferase
VEEVDRLSIRDVDALATILNGKPFICGDRPCGADATVFAFVAGILAPNFEMGGRRAAEAHPNLLAYRETRPSSPPER